MLNTKKQSFAKIKVGLGSCGIATGALETYQKLEQYIKKNNLPFLISQTGCLGACFSEPNVTVSQDKQTIIYQKITEDLVPDFLLKIKEKKIFESNVLVNQNNLSKHPFFKHQIKLITKNCGIIDPYSIDDYLNTGGFKGLQKALRLNPEEVIEKVTQAKIRGRGGGGFLAGNKWSLMAKEINPPKYVICNFDEGDPGAFMNRAIVESDPFRLIEGIIIAGYATGSSNAFIYGRDEYPIAIKTLKNAIHTAHKHGFLGRNILKTNFSFNIELTKGAGAYVCGEETALMESIEGKRGMPRNKPPYPTQYGLWGCPTVINNVSTLCHVATLFQIGEKEYLKHGTSKSSGTKEICLTGNIRRPGVIEVPFGINIKTILEEIGGGNNTPIKAIQTGGPSGGCIPVNELENLVLDYEEICAKGSIMGSGGMVVIDERTCMVDVAKYFLKFTQSESCGKCTPCREGTKRLLEILEKITGGKASMQDLNNLEDLCYAVADASLCGLGQTAPKPIITTLRYFKNEYLTHIQEKKCPAGVCPIAPASKLYHITADCVGCGKCKKSCPVNAIVGQPGKKHQIVQKNCLHCDACYRVCSFKAITLKT